MSSTSLSVLAIDDKRVLFELLGGGGAPRHFQLKVARAEFGQKLLAAVRELRQLGDETKLEIYFEQDVVGSTKTVLDLELKTGDALTVVIGEHEPIDPADIGDTNMATALMAACAVGNPRRVRKLLKAGADANEDWADSGFYMSPLSVALEGYCPGPKTVEIVRALLDAGARPNYVYGEEATTALSEVMQYAASAQKDQLVRMLIKAGGVKIDALSED